MPYRRGSFTLTPPSTAAFAISVILAVAAALVRYADVRIPLVSADRAFDLLVVAYLVMLAGVLFRRI